MSYQLVVATETRGRYQDLLAEARLRGEGQLFEDAYRQIEDELIREGGLGEQNYWLPTGRPVYHRVVGPVSVHYALYAVERVIWLFRLDPSPSKG